MKFFLFGRVGGVVLAVAVLAVAVPVQAQASGDKPVLVKKPEPAAETSTIKVEAKLVVVPAVVRDKKGAIVMNLAQADFALQVNGKPQAVRYFDHDNDVPLTLGLVVDASRSMSSYIDDERKASQTFLQTMLQPAKAAEAKGVARPADKAFVIQFAHQIEMLHDVSDSVPQLAASLRELGTESASFKTQDNSGEVDREGRRAHGGGTALYDAVYLAADEVTSKQKGRKALVLLTDGNDNGSKEGLNDAIEAAQRADTIVYAIYYKGEQHRDNNPGNNGGGRHGGYGGGGYPGGGGGYPGGGGGYPGGGGGYPGGGGNNPNGGSNPNGGNNPNSRGGGGYKPNVDGRKVLERLCGETGGRVFEVDRKSTVEGIYAQIGEELRSQYRLGFTPGDEAAKEGYHQITLTLNGEAGKNKPLIETRDGYYTGEER